MVLHSCACVYLRYASNVAIFIADRRASFYAWMVGWVNFQFRGVLLIWLVAGQGPNVLRVGAGGVVGHFFSHLSFLSSFFLPLSG